MVTKTSVPPRAELFDGLLPDELEQVNAVGRRVELPAGARLFRFGEPALTLFVIESGQVALTLPLIIRGETRDVTVEERGPGSVIGWSALVPPHRLTLGAEARSPLIALGFERRRLGPLFEQQPRLKLVIISNLAGVIGGRLCQLEGILLRDLQRFVSGAPT